VDWSGFRGKVCFYQSELTYDVTGPIYEGVAGYRVHEEAEYHKAKGVGVYSYFRDHDNVRVPSAVVHEFKTGFYQNALAVRLYGYHVIQTIING
jgi:hypothetical protein